MRKTSDIIWQDAQHQVLFDILDLIKQPGAGRVVLEKLQDYVEVHFSMEERYMEYLNYPGRITHVEAHNRFRDEISKALRENPEPDELLMQIIGTFLTEWLSRHVFGIDKVLEDFILNANVR